MDTLQWFSHRGWESNQEVVVAIHAGEDQHLDQELRCILCEERPAPIAVVEDKSAGSGQEELSFMEGMGGWGKERNIWMSSAQQQ